MPTIKYDITDTTVEDAEAFGQGFDSPKPGVYRAKVKEVNPGFSKDQQGEPDRSKPKIEVVYEIIQKPYAGAQLFSHIPLKGSTSFNEYAKRRMAQLLLATGQVNTTGGEGTLNTDKIKGKVVRVRVKSGKDHSGDYRGEFGAVFKDDDSKVKLTGDGEVVSDDELISDDELSDDDGIIEEDGDTDWDARLSELMAMQGADLQTIAREWKEAGWDIKISGKKADVAAAVVAVEQAAAEQGEAGSDEELLEEESEELLAEEEGAEYLTEEQLNEMDAKELMALAKGDFDIDPKAAGIKTKSALVAAILEAQAAPSDDDVLPF